MSSWVSQGTKEPTAASGIVVWSEGESDGEWIVASLPGAEYQGAVVDELLWSCEEVDACSPDRVVLSFAMEL